MKFSIIINNYNYADFLKEAIESAVNQKFKDFEIIVVDDGSTDHSKSIIEEHRYHEDLRIIYKENGGQASAMNRGFEVSSGDGVLFLDSDDMLKPETLQEISAKWNKHLAKLHFRLSILNGHNFTNKTLPRKKYKLSYGARVWEEVYIYGNHITVPTSGNVFSRMFLEQVMPIPEAKYKISADDYLITKAPFYGPFVSIEKELGYYRVHGKNSHHGFNYSNRTKAKDIIARNELKSSIQSHEFAKKGIVLKEKCYTKSNFLMLELDYFNKKASFFYTICKLIKARRYSMVRKIFEVIVFSLNSIKYQRFETNKDYFV